jgi:glycosyltransferase involved in cell wall biosynthesis
MATSNVLRLKEDLLVKIVIAALSAPCSLNGVSRHAANLARGLLALPDAPEVHFLAGSWQKEIFPSAIGRTNSRFHLHLIQIRHSNFARIAWYYRDLPAISAQLEADVMHMAYPSPVRAGAYRCPTVVSLHDLYPFEIPENFGIVRSEVSRRLMRQCLTKIDAIACVSDFTKSRIARWLPAEVSRKAVTIPNSIAAISGAGVAPRQLRGGLPFVLCVAQHRQNKNVPLALRIFAQALRVETLPVQARIVVVGNSGPDTGRILNEVRSLGLGDRVVLLSGISDQALLWCYRNCSLLLAPSSIEGFGLPIAEALTAGCPVVCSDIPPFREVGGDRCRYVPFGEGMMEGYLGAIRQALSEPRRFSVSMPQLAPVSIAARYMDLYRQLARFRGVSQNGMLRHPYSEARKVEIPAE